MLVDEDSAARHEVIDEVLSLQRALEEINSKISSTHAMNNELGKENGALRIRYIPYVTLTHSCVERVRGMGQWARSSQPTRGAGVLRPRGPNQTDTDTVQPNLYSE